MLLKSAMSALVRSEQETDHFSTIDNADQTRRLFLKTSAKALGVGVGLGSGLLSINPAFAAQKERCLALFCPNTGETIRLVYWVPDEGYISESIKEISITMRDRRDGNVKLIDPKLLDQMYALQEKLHPREPIHMLCGYRSPRTNAMLRKRNRGVAKASYHMKGMAVDMRMPGRSLSDLHRAALSLHAGGVGRYRRSRFVHLDTGPVRTWG